MTWMTGFLALVLLGGDAPESAGGAASESGVKFQVRLLEMKGIEWRGSLHDRLTPAARQGTSSIWTANRDVVKNLNRAAENVVTAPAILAQPGTPANLRQESSRSVVANLRRVADGPPGKNTCVAFVPEVDEVRDRFELDLTGNVVDQGLMAKVHLRETHFLVAHAYTVQDAVTNPKDKTPTVIKAQIQVPEVVSGQVEGEWLIPTDGVLVIGLGAHTVADAKGKAVIHERVAIIEPIVARADPLAMAAKFEAASQRPARASWTKPAAAPQPVAPPLPIGPSLLTPNAAPAAPAPAPAQPDAPKWRLSLGIGTGRVELPKETEGGVMLASLPLPIRPFPYLHVAVGLERLNTPATANMPKAVPPTRDLPTPIAPDGTVVKLPPLPDEDLLPASSDDSDEVRPAPQSRPVGRPAPSVPPMAGLPSAAKVPGHLLAITSTPGKLVCPMEEHQVVDVNSPEPFDFCFPAPAPEFPSRVSTFQARGNILTVRDAKSGNCKLVCDELFLLPPGAANSTSIMTSGGFRSFFASTPNARFDAGCVAGLADGTGAHSDCCIHGREAMSRDEAVTEAGGEVQEPGEDAGPTLSLQLQSATGASQYEGQVDLRSIVREPMSIRVPMPDGSVVEVQARVVSKAGKK